MSGSRSLASVFLATGALAACEESIQTPDASPPEPGPEVLAEQACGRYYWRVRAAHFVEGDIVLECIGTESQQIESIVRFDVVTHESSALWIVDEEEPVRFGEGRVIDSMMYAWSPSCSAYRPHELVAMRLDAGATQPTTIVGSTGCIRNIVATPARVYWTWDRYASPEDERHGISSVPAVGGEEERLAALPFSPNKIALVGDSIYMLGYPMSGSSSVEIIRVSRVDGAIESVLGLVSSGQHFHSWFHAYQDHMLFAEVGKESSKLRRIRGADVDVLDPFDCGPSGDAVLSDSMLASRAESYGFPACKIQEGLTLTDLKTRETRGVSIDFEQRAERAPNGMTLVGSRDGWVYVLEGEQKQSLVRYPTKPL